MEKRPQLLKFRVVFRVFFLRFDSIESFLVRTSLDQFKKSLPLLIGRSSRSVSGTVNGKAPVSVAGVIIV